MASERLFHDYHLPGGINITPNPSDHRKPLIDQADIVGPPDAVFRREDFERILQQYSDIPTTSGWFSHLPSYQKSAEDQYATLLLHAGEAVQANDFIYGESKQSEALAADDNHQKAAHTKAMNDITREELSANLSAIEERMDKRVERMEQDSARRSDDLRREMRLRERSARREAIASKEALKAHIESNDKAVASTLAALERTEKEFGSVKQANKEQRYWMAGIGVAIVLGIMGANATIFGGGKTFFDGGANSVTNQQQVEKLIQEAKSQSDANSALLKQIQAQQKIPAAPTQAPSPASTK